jgi:hypothetical protein
VSITQLYESRKKEKQPRITPGLAIF